MPWRDNPLINLENPFILSLMLSAAAVAPGVAVATEPAVREEVIVNATRVSKKTVDLPAAIGVVDKEQIQLARQQLGLDESLSRIPGIFLQNRYNFAQDLRVAIRGSGARGNFGVRGVKIIVDGIPNTLPDGQGQFDSVDISSVGQIDVLRGPSSSLYGNASGGVIAITSEAAPAQPYLEARTAAGEYGYVKSQIKTAGKSARMDYLMSASYMELEGYRDQSRAENKNFNSRLRFQLDETSDLTALINLFDSPMSQDPGGITAAAVEADPTQAFERNVRFDAGEAIEQQKLGFKYRKTLGEQHELVARTYVLLRDFENSLPFVDGGIVQFDRTFLGGGLQYTNSVPLWSRANRITLGIDFDRQEDDRRQFDNLDGARGALVFDQREAVSSLGLFIQEELLLTDGVEITLGLRYDEVEFDVDDEFLADGDDSGDRDLDSVSGSVGVLWQLSDPLHLYANLATSFETPTTTELANPAGGGFNQSLDPQHAINYEFGIKGVSANRKVHYDLALFAIKVDDELTPFELAQFPGRTFFENAGESSRRGVELAVNMRLTEGLDAAVAYTYSDFEFDRFNNAGGESFDGKNIPGIPRHLFHSAFTYKHRGGFFAATDVLFVGRFYADNANNAEADSYRVANLRMGWKFQMETVEITPFIGFSNLLDEEYSANVRINAFGGRYFEPAPGRNVYGGLGVRLSL